mmetsp:Transcript_31170/g.69316  ORF Transcript_31170/g.69316 Transcript_31170/m.69316 type:complete len:94 (+) Transcript_31170:651-932(+)
MVLSWPACQACTAACSRASCPIMQPAAPGVSLSAVPADYSDLSVAWGHDLWLHGIQHSMLGDSTRTTDMVIRIKTGDQISIVWSTEPCLGCPG